MASSREIERQPTKRSSKACDACKERKSRCDLNPTKCLTCVDKGTQCTQRVPYTNRTLPRDIVEQLERGINRLGRENRRLERENDQLRNALELRRYCELCASSTCNNQRDVGPGPEIALNTEAFHQNNSGSVLIPSGPNWQSQAWPDSTQDAGRLCSGIPFSLCSPLENGVNWTPEAVASNFGIETANDVPFIAPGPNYGSGISGTWTIPHSSR